MTALLYGMDQETHSASVHTLSHSPPAAGVQLSSSTLQLFYSTSELGIQEYLNCSQIQHRHDTRKLHQETALKCGLLSH